MLTKTISSAVQGVDARSVTVEASVGPGIKMSMVGLPDNAVRESIDRIKTAIQHNQYAIGTKSVNLNWNCFESLTNCQCNEHHQYC